MRYYRRKLTGSVYRTSESNFSDGTPTLIVQRWNFHSDSWNGHIHDHAETRDSIANLNGIDEITQEQAIILIDA